MAVYTWDAIYDRLKVDQGGLPNKSTQDMLDTFWTLAGYPDGTLGADAKVAFYESQGAVGDSLGDLEYDYWYRVGPNILAAKGAVFAIDAAQSISGEQWVLNRGSGGQVLRARYGSVGRAEIRNGVGLVLPGVTGNYASIPDPSALAGATQLDVRFYIASHTSSAQFVLGQGDGTSGSSLSFVVSMSSNHVSLRASDGTSAILTTSSLPFDSWIDSSGAFAAKLTWRASDGRVQFFAKSSSLGTCAADLASNAGWTAVGTDQTNVTAPLYDYVKELTFGCLGTSLLFSGVIHAVQIATTIDGAPFVSTNFTAQPDLTSSFVASTGQTVTVTAADAVDTNDPLWLPWDGENYVYLPGTAGDADRISTSTLTTGASNVYDIRVLAELDSMTPAVDRTLFSYTGADPNRSIRWYLQTSGKLAAEVTPTGSIASYIAITSTTTVGASGKLWFRFTIEGNVAGSYRGRFYRCDGSIASPTPSDWVQIGSDVTGASFTFATCSSTWGTVGAPGLQGKWYRASIATSIDGAPLIDIRSSDITDPAATNFTCTTGQTCSIGRATSGRKAAVVTRPIWLFGTDDYLEVADNDLLDFAAGESLSVVAVMRQHATPPNFAVVAYKSAGAGYIVQNNGTAQGMSVQVNDGTYVPNTTSGNPSAGSRKMMALVRDVVADQVLAYNGSTAGTPATDTTTATLANTGSLLVGAYNDMELLAVGIFRRALSATEIAQIVTYYGAS